MGTTRHTATITVDTLGFPASLTVNNISMAIPDGDLPAVDIPGPMDRLRAAAALLGYPEVETLPHPTGGAWRVVFARPTIEPGDQVIMLAADGSPRGSGRLATVIPPRCGCGERYVVEGGSGRTTVLAVRRPDGRDVEWGVWLYAATLFLRRGMWSEVEATGWTSRAYRAGLDDAMAVPVTEELLEAEAGATRLDVAVDSRRQEGALVPVALVADNELVRGWSLGKVGGLDIPGDFVAGLEAATTRLARRLGRRPVAWRMHRDSLGEWFTPRFPEADAATRVAASRPAPCPRCFNPDPDHTCLDLDDMAAELVDRLVVDRDYPVTWSAEDVRRALPAFLRAIYAAVPPREES